jgi:hypothetical protein
MLVIKRIIGGVLIVIGLSLFGSYLFAPLSSRDRNILHQQAEYGGAQSNYPTSDKKFYLLGGFACCIIGGVLLKK